MKSVVLVVVGSMVLGGCTGPSLQIASKGKFYNLESKSVGALDASVKTVITFYCSPEADRYEEVATENGTARCDGRFIVLDINQGKQTGYLTGVFSSAIQGAAFAGGMYLLGDGIGDSGSKTTNNNDTTSTGGSSSAAAGSTSISGAKASASSQSISKGGAGGSVNNGYRRHR